MSLTRCFIVLLLSTSGLYSTPWWLHNHEPQFLLIFNPAGDAQYAGRMVQDTTARSITHQLAHQLEFYLHRKYGSTVKVLVTHRPFDALSPWQVASFVNQWRASLVISLECFEDNQPRPRLFVYQTAGQSTPIAHPDTLTVYRADQTYLAHSPQTQTYAEQLCNQLQNQLDARWECSGPHALPLAPLKGMVVPALLLEIGLKDKDDWRALAEPLGLALYNVAHTHQNTQHAHD